MGKNKSKDFGGKYSQKRLDHAKRSATDALKTSSKGVIQTTAEATGDLIGNKIANYEIQKKLQMSMIKTYLKKDMYLQKKDKKLLMD